MSLILARSPYFVSNEGFDEGATLTVNIGDAYTGFNPPNPDPVFKMSVIKSYTLNFRQQTELDISPLIRDVISYNSTYDTDFIVYVTTSVSGTISGAYQSPVLGAFYASDGYSFYEDGYNYSIESDLINNGFYAGSNNTMYKFGDETIRIPLLNTSLSPDNPPTTITAKFYLNDNLIKTESIVINVDDSSSNAYKKIEGSGFNIKARIESDGGTFVDSTCFQRWLRNTSLEDFDKVVLTNNFYTNEHTVFIKTISECKYQPYEIIFKNRYGVEESLWFFKKSEYSLNTTSEEYRGNTFAQFKAGDLSYHTYQDYNVNGKEMMVLNTGFLEESFSENFKQLGLSEKVYIMKDNVKLPVKLKSRDITYKQSVNQKLIDYRIEVEFAYDKLNNIV